MDYLIFRQLKSSVNIQKYSNRFDNEKNMINSQFGFNNTFLPMPMKIWPSEGKLIFVILSFWCIFGLFILGSASWWVANKEIDFSLPAD